MSRLNAIKKYMDLSTHWSYTGQAKHKKTGKYFMFYWDSYNQQNYAVRLLGGIDGAPTGPAQPRNAMQIIKNYGPFERTVIKGMT